MDDGLRLAAEAALANFLLKLADTMGEASVESAWRLAQKARAARPKPPRKARRLDARTEDLLSMARALAVIYPHLSRRGRFRELERIERQQRRHFQPGSLARKLYLRERASNEAHAAKLARDPESARRRQAMAARLLDNQAPSADADT